MHSQKLPSRRYFLSYYVLQLMLVLVLVHTQPLAASRVTSHLQPAVSQPDSGGRELSQTVESCSHKHCLDTGCQHHLRFSQALGKIAGHIDIGIPETFGFLANERAPARDILNNLTA